MKKLIFILFSLVFFIACTKEKESNLHITGQVQGLKKGKLFLQKIKDDTLLVNLDSMRVDGDPHFEFRAYLESPQILFLYLDKKDGQKNDDIIPFFAEKGVMTIETQLDGFQKNAIITGSENQKILEEYEKMMEKFNRRNADFIQKNFTDQHSENEDLLLAIQKQYDQLLRAKYIYTVNYAIDHKDMEIAPYLALAKIFDANITFLDTIYNSLSKDVQKSLYGEGLKELLKERRKQEK